MRRPLHSLLLAIGLLVLASMFLAPYTPPRKQISPDGTVILRTESERRLLELRVNWFAYLCLAGAAASFVWTVYLVIAGVVHLVKAKKSG